ncbi:hypothetical protein KAR91_44265 [Candidatus Pacearchaeota archaeon]|nr:hypothetical protein [Candidatus Pacearchaeota archaeon]
MAKGKIGKQMMKWIPQLAAMYAFYQYYSDRGIEGIQADLEAITIEGIQAKLTALVTGIAAFIVGDIVAQYITKNQYARIIIRSIAYYVGGKQLASVLRQGAGYGGSGGSGKGISRFAANPYMRG